MFENPLIIKVWAQMFFDDGTVTQGKYIPESIFSKPSQRNNVVLELLNDTNRKKGFIFIWGGRKFYGRHCELTPKNSYSSLSLLWIRLTGGYIIRDQVLTYNKL